jgi:hypothetical protein
MSHRSLKFADRNKRLHFPNMPCLPADRLPQELIRDFLAALFGHWRRPTYQRAEELLRKHQAKVHRVAEYLIANRAIEQPMIDRLLEP